MTKKLQQSRPSLTLPAPAKLNLFLHLTGRRADGYHNLQTLFQFVELHDELSFQLTTNGRYSLSTNLQGVAVADNLVTRAVKLLQPLRPKASLGVDIQLHKNLPQGAGLGAGSSNAATSLLALNYLWQLGLSTAELASLGLQLGADVPVFVQGVSAWAEGVGELLQPVKVPEQTYLVLFPGCACDTAQLFQHPDLPRSTAPLKLEQASQHLGSNAFAAVVRHLYPPVEAAFAWFTQQELQPYLTGSGSCVYSVVPNAQQGQQLLASLPNRLAGSPVQAWVTQGCSVSPAITALRKLVNF